MRLLLDTHALAWWLLEDEHLPPRMFGLLADSGNQVHVSAVSAYEAVSKHRLGKWPEIGPLAAAFEEIVSGQRFELLPISARHAVRAGLFPAEHRDPFDRMLAAQAELEALLLVTNDRRLQDFGTRTIW